MCFGVFLRLGHAVHQHAGETRLTTLRCGRPLAEPLPRLGERLRSRWGRVGVARLDDGDGMLWTKGSDTYPSVARPEAQSVL